MATIQGLFRRIRDTKNRLAWVLQKNGSYGCTVLGKIFEVRSPSMRQARLMKDQVLTDAYALGLRRYLKAIDLGPDQTILDIGGNIGYMALAYSAAFPGSEVICFEPSDLNFEFLSFNTRRQEKIRLVKLGLHHEKGKASLRLPSRAQNSHMASKSYRNTGLYSMYGEGEMVSSEIELMPLDQWLQGYSDRGRIGFVKIDVEGNELNVLRGAEQLLKDVGPALEVELNPGTLGMSGSTFIGVRDYLGRFGYQAHLFSADKLMRLESPPPGNLNVVFIKKDR